MSLRRGENRFLQNNTTTQLQQSYSQGSDDITNAQKVTAYDGFEYGIKSAMNSYFEKKGNPELKYDMPN